MEIKKAMFTRSQQMAPVSLAITFCISCIYLYIGCTQEPLPGCTDPWLVWYKLAGVLSILQVFDSIYYMKAKLKTVMSDTLLRVQVYREQGRLQEADEAIRSATPKEIDATLELEQKRCTTCPLTCALIAVFVWGIVMLFHNSGCNNMTAYLKWLLLFQGGITIVLNLAHRANTYDSE